MAPLPNTEDVWVFPDGTEVTCDRSDANSCQEDPYHVLKDRHVSSHTMAGAMYVDGYYGPISRSILSGYMSGKPTVPEGYGTTERK